MVLGEKVREALASVLPITVIVLILCFTIAPVPTDILLAFLVVPLFPARAIPENAAFTPVPSVITLPIASVSSTAVAERTA